MLYAECEYPIPQPPPWWYRYYRCCYTSINRWGNFLTITTLIQGCLCVLLPLCVHVRCQYTSYRPMRNWGWESFSHFLSLLIQTKIQRSLIMKASWNHVKFSKKPISLCTLTLWQWLIFNMYRYVALCMWVSAFFFLSLPSFSFR